MSAYIMEYWIEPQQTIKRVLEEYVDISPYEMLFEADNPDISKNMRQNANLEQQGDSAIMKIIKGIVGLIGRILETITDFFSKLFMNGNDRAAFEEMQRVIQQNPEYKNKKLTIKEFKAEKARVRDLEKQSRGILADIQNGKLSTPGTRMIEDMQNTIQNGVAPASVLVAMDVAVRAAQSNTDTAKWIKTLLIEDRNKLKMLEGIVGKKDVKDFKKHIEKCNKMAFWYRLRINLFGKHYKNMQDVILDTIAEVEGIAKGKFSLCNIGLMLKMLGNKKVRKNMMAPAAKAGLNELKNNAQKAIYDTINPNQPEKEHGALNFLSGGRIGK